MEAGFNIKHMCGDLPPIGNSRLTSHWLRKGRMALHDQRPGPPRCQIEKSEEDIYQARYKYQHYETLPANLALDITPRTGKARVPISFSSRRSERMDAAVNTGRSGAAAETLLSSACFSSSSRRFLAPSDTATDKANLIFFSNSERLLDSIAWKHASSECMRSACGCGIQWKNLMINTFGS